MSAFDKFILLLRSIPIFFFAKSIFGIFEASILIWVSNFGDSYKNNIYFMKNEYFFYIVDKIKR